MAKKKKVETNIKKMYVVMTFGFDYDDNTYTQSQYGDPIRIFDNEADADQACAELNIAELKGKNLREYGFDLEYITSDVLGLKAWFKKFGADIDEGNSYWTVPLKLTDQDYIELYNMLYIQFHSVREVDFHERVQPTNPPKSENRFAKLGRDE